VVATALRDPGYWALTVAFPATTAIQGAAATCLPLIGRGPLGAIGCVLGFGLGFGVATIARPAILADRYGTTAYATGTYRDVALGVCALCLLAATALLSVRHLDHRPGA
jgi:hypothetical protein